jgi:hypothetical protein
MHPPPWMRTGTSASVAKEAALHVAVLDLTSGPIAGAMRRSLALVRCATSTTAKPACGTSGQSSLGQADRLTVTGAHALAQDTPTLLPG